MRAIVTHLEWHAEVLLIPLMARMLIAIIINCLIYSQCTHMQRSHSQFYESVFESLISYIEAEIL